MSRRISPTPRRISGRARSAREGSGHIHIHYRPAFDEGTGRNNLGLCYRPSIHPNQDSIAFGLYHSIICSESVPFITDEEVALTREKTWVGDFRIRTQREVCSAWPRATVPRSFIDPVRSNKPVLLISGDLDPAAQPEYAAEAATYLINSRHVVVPNASHSLFSTCTSDLVVRFIDRGSAEGLDTSCVDKIKLPPFKLQEPKAITVPQKLLTD